MAELHYINDGSNDDNQRQCQVLEHHGVLLQLFNWFLHGRRRVINEETAAIIPKVDPYNSFGATHHFFMR